MQTNAPRGYRGYIFSRPVNGSRIPQHVQNIVLRDYARRKGLFLKLAAVEYAMPGSHMILKQVLGELPDLDGILAYSIFLLPADAEARHAIYRRVIDLGKTLHGAVEGLVLATEDDAQRIEDIILLERAVRSAPTSL